MQVLLALLASMSIFFLIFPLFAFYFLFVGIKGWHDTRRVFFNAPPLFLCLGGIGAADAAGVRLRG
jgi:asparagine N-glycosylation enzyme membrane subunit Stt3